jgi:hypothetical protein
MLKFPSIESFRHAVANVKRSCDYHQMPYPKVKYVGTVKLHGTNAGIEVDFANKTLIPQSRERVLSTEADKAGFAAFVENNHDELFEMFNNLFSFFTTVMNPVVTVYGEWIGPGIQKNVGINQLSQKTFVMFFVAFHDQIESSDDGQIHCTFYPLSNWVGIDEIAVPHVTHIGKGIESPVIEIDFGQPDLVVEQLEKLTSEYEEHCPFAGTYGIDGIGEGLVWIPENSFGILPGGFEHRMWFKTKGEKHGNKSTNNTVKVAVTAEKVEDFNALISQIMPMWRLEQGMSKLRESGIDEPSKAQTGDFIKWVVSDVHKEEIDTVEASEFEWKVVASELSRRARQWFFTKV